MACLLGRLFIAALLLPAGGRRSVAQRSQARNCSLCRADDLLQRRRSGTVMVTGLPVRGSNRVMVIRTSHTQLSPADVQGATSAERCLCPEKLICLGLFVGPALSTDGLVILWRSTECPRSYRTSASDSRLTQQVLYA